MDDRRLAYLDAMGIQTWAKKSPPVPLLQRGVAGDDVADFNPTLQNAAEVDAAISNHSPLQKGDRGDLDLDVLRTRVANCTACALHQGRTQTVFGVGDHNAQWMVVGEAPGAEEDRLGEPFVGRAGQLLNAMLLAIGLSREAVYIANVVKCRPPGNRDPAPEETAACEPYLQHQIALINPRVILVVGRIAAHNLLKTDAPLGTLRGKRWSYADTGIPVIVTYHPAYLLRSPKEKRKAWEDLQFAKKVFAASPARPATCMDALVSREAGCREQPPTALAHPCSAETR